MRGRKQEVPEIDPAQRAVVEELLHQRALNPRVRERLRPSVVVLPVRDLT